MKVGLHQPQYIPWPGYFAKILHCDFFYFYDNAQYVKNSIINRNKILIKEDGSYLTIPVVKGRLTETINEKRIVDERWKEKHRKTIATNYSKHPNYNELKMLVDKALNIKSEYLSDYNITFIKAVCDYLKIKTIIKNSGDYKSNKNCNPTEYIVSIVKNESGVEYISGSGVLNYLDRELLVDNGIALKCFKFFSSPYSQNGKGEFVPGLSIIDLVANLPIVAIREYLKSNWRQIQ